MCSSDLITFQASRSMSQQGNQTHPFGVNLQRATQSETRTLDRVTEIFGDKFDADVIRLILEECNWKEEEAVEKLCKLASDEVPGSGPSQPIGLDIIACSFLDSPDEGTVTQTPQDADESLQEDCEEVKSTAGDFLSQAASPKTSSSQTAAHMEEAGTKGESRSDGISGLTYDYSTLFASDDLPPFTSGASTLPGIQLSDGFALSGEPLSAKVGQTSDSVLDLYRDKQTESKNTGTATSSSTETKEKVSQGFDFEKALAKPTVGKHGIHVYKGQGLGSLNGLIASSPQDTTTVTTDSRHTKSEPSVKRLQPEGVGVPSIPAFPSWQQSLISPVSEAHSKSTSEVLSNPSVTGSTKLKTTNSSADQSSSTMALSAGAPEFIPTFTPSSSSTPFYPQHPQFFTPRFAGQQGFFPVGEGATFARSPMKQMDSPSPMARMFGMPSRPTPRNVALNRFVGSNMYLLPNPPLQPGSNNNSASASSLQYAATAKSPAHRASTAPKVMLRSPQGSESEEKSPIVERIERHIHEGCKLLVLLRGLPGSGKSYLARQIQGDGQVFSTDEFFMNGNIYEYNPDKISDAHDWNKKRVQKALDDGVSPVIVDNTNVMMWEMLPYAEMAHSRGYTVEVVQPDTSWSFQPKRLAKCNSHGVPIDSIKRMKDRYETVDTDSLMAYLKSKVQKRPQGTTQMNHPRKKVITSSTASNVKQPSLRPKPIVVQNSQKTQAQAQSNSTGRRARKNSQKEFQSVRDTCVKMLKDGVKDDEIEAMIFMANLKDNERHEIKDYLDRTKDNMKTQTNQKQTKSKGSKNKGLSKESTKSLKDFKPFSVLDTSDLPEADQSGSQLGVHDDKTSFKGKEIVSGSSSPGLLSWQKPQPQRKAKSKVLPLTGTQKQDGTNHTSSTRESAAEVKATKVLEVETAWEKPLPRRERTPRTARNSESEKVDTEDNNNQAGTTAPAEEDALAGDTGSMGSGTQVELARQKEMAAYTSAAAEVEKSSEKDISGYQRAPFEKDDQVQDMEIVPTIEDKEDSVAPLSTESKSDCDSEADLTNDSDVIVEEDTKSVSVSEEERTEDDSKQSRETETDLPQRESTTPEKSQPLAEDGISKKDASPAVSVCVTVTEETEQSGDVTEKPKSSVCNKSDEITAQTCDSSHKTDQTSSATDSEKKDEIVSTSDNAAGLVAYSSSEEEDDEKPEVSGDHTSSDAASVLTVTSPEKQSTYGASGENSESSCPASPRRKVRRKKNKAPLLPFLDEGVKEKLSSDWKNFKPENQIPDTCPEISGDEEKAEVSRRVTSKGKRSASTQTEGRDFGVAAKGTETNTEDGYKFLSGNGHYVPADLAGPAISSVKTQGHKLKLDKSTTVDITYEPSVEWLYDCFPGVAVAHLNEVLEVCNDDVDMAVELMFEWGISTPITPQDKRQLSREMAKQRSQSVHSSPRSPGGVLGDSMEESLPTPPTLVDLCMRLIPDNSPAVQQRIINSSEQRLQRIEKMETERVRTISLDEAGASGGFNLPDGFSLTAFTSAAASQKGSAYSLEPVSESVSSSESSKASPEKGSAADTQFVQAVDRKRGRQNQPQGSIKTALSAQLGIRPRACVSESAVEYPRGRGVPSDLALSLPTALVTNLEQLFGPLPILNRGSASSLTVHLDHGTAHRLYQCLAQSLCVQGQAEASENERSRQLREDEALAQLLQEEEEIDYTLAAISATPSRTTKIAPTKQRHKPFSDIDIRLPGYSTPPPPLARFRPYTKPVNFQDIIDEEMVNQQNHDKQVEMLEATGDHIAIATKLKREKLYQHFPGVDEQFLEGIFQANGYTLETTVRVIEAALGTKQPVSHRLEMPSARDNADFDVDIEVAKQESLRDVNSGERSEEQYQRWDAWYTEDADYQELRQEALLHYRMRRECFTKAHEAHRRGMKEVAVFYSQQANNHYSRMKEANTRASEKMLETRQTKVDREMTLDLHGFHVEEAIAILKRVLVEKEEALQVNSGVHRQHLNVVTGQGKHSQHGVAKIKPAVKAYLESAEYRFVEKPGVLKVSLRPAA